MNSNQNSEPLQISNNDKKAENKNHINNIIPQSTKHAGHSKIKGFSFQLDMNNHLNRDKDKTKEENIKERFQIIEEESNKNTNKYHKNKISLSSTPSHLLNNNKDSKYKKEMKSENSKNALVFGNNDSKNNSNQQERSNLNGNPTKVSIDTPLNITDLIRDQNYAPLDKSFLKKSFEKYEPARHSGKSLSVVKSFAANTHQGTVRKYNEDRVSIILNIVKPNTFKGSYWPTCSFFAVFDGHGGSKCADFLKDNLHNYVSLELSCLLL